MTRKRICVLGSGNGTTFGTLYPACVDNTINGDIVCLGSDKETAFILTRAKDVDIPTFFIDHKKATAKYEAKSPHYPSSDEVVEKITQYLPISHPLMKFKIRQLAARMIAEKYLLDKLAEFGVDTLVCAGYMRILSPYFLNEFQPDPTRPRSLNSHPALLPSFPGTNGYKDAWEYGVKTHGATVHYIDYGEDTGAIIDQSHYKRLPTDTLETFSQHGLELEWELYKNALRLHCDDSLEIVTSPSGRRTVEEISK